MFYAFTNIEKEKKSLEAPVSSTETASLVSLPRPNTPISRYAKIYLYCILNLSRNDAVIGIQSTSN